MTKPTKLPHKELDKIKSEMRRWDSNCFAHLARVFSHLAFVEEALKKSEAENRALRQSTMQFGDEVKVYQSPAPRDFSEVKSLKERLVDMVKNGEVDSPQWQRTLRFNGLSQAQALAMAEAYV